MSDLIAYFSKPQGTIARWVDVVAVSMAGMSSLYCYYLVEFNLCLKINCDALVVTSYFASASWWYLILGAALLGVGVFIFKARDLPRAFAVAIVISSLSGFILSGMAVFAILKEIKTLT